MLLEPIHDESGWVNDLIQNESECLLAKPQWTKNIHSE